VFGAFLPGNIYILGLSVPLGMYGLDRLILMSRNKQRIEVRYLGGVSLCARIFDCALHLHTRVCNWTRGPLAMCMLIHIEMVPGGTKGALVVVVE
jgi:hypothetical protein